MLQDPDSAKADCAMRAMMQMDKLDIQRLQQAYNQS
jgi:predicted 3-demethylubiquinone-9 3-methyltransferase (glyoxalase superfamily)